MTLLCFRLATVDESASRLDPSICRDMFRKIGNKANYIAENCCTLRTMLFSYRPLSTSRDGRLPQPLVTLRRRAPGSRFDEHR